MPTPLSSRTDPAGAVRVFAAGAIKAVVLDLAGSFETETGRCLDFVFDTVGALRDRILQGERADATILSTQALEAIGSKGHSQGPMIHLGNTGVALAGRRGARAALIDTADRFREVLLSAGSIGYADPERGATAGRHFIAVLERMELSGKLADRLHKFPFGVDAITALGRGEIEIAVSQATEILTQKDVTYLGLFPAPYELSTGYGAASLSDTEGARQFLAVLGSPAGKAALQRAGFA